MRTQEQKVWIEKGRKQALEKVEKIIDEWRVQLEDVGFITIDKHFVDELKTQIKKEDDFASNFDYRTK